MSSPLFALLTRYRSACVFNPWSEQDAGTDREPRAAAHRRERLRHHFDVDAELILVGEASGYQGCHVSGIPFTSERLVLEGAIPRVPVPAARLSTRARPWSEPSATTVWGALGELGVAERTILWNAFPWHPYRAGNPQSNRTPTPAERAAGLEILALLLGQHPRATVFAVGRQAEASLVAVGRAHRYLRHPSMAGAADFRRGLSAGVKQDRNRKR